MSYTLNDYYKYANTTSTRIEVYSDKGIAANLLAFHKQNGVLEVPVCDCVDKTYHLLPMPVELMEILDKRINSAQRRVVVTGIDAYLSLLDKKGEKLFMTLLKKRIDDGKNNAVYLISRNYFDNTKFLNPKYENDLYIAYIGDTVQYISPPNIFVVSEKWIQCGNNPTNWNVLLQELGLFEPTSEYTLVLKNQEIGQAGLSENVSQLIEISSVAKRHYGICPDLSISVLEMLILKCKDNNILPNDYLKMKFGEDNVNERNIIKRLLELHNDPLWTAYVWFLKKIIKSSSYLAKVLSENITADNLLLLYVCDAAITLLLDENAVYFAKERADAIREIGVIANPLIIEFISKTRCQPNESVACWLNCGTEAELIEIVDRVAKSDLTVGLPRIWNNLYPQLSDYLSDKFDCDNSYIAEYFRDYRRMKIADTVTQEFVKKAFDATLPDSVFLRDSVLQELSSHDKTALLVVDGMGAEYFPLIRAMAQRKSIYVESAIVAAAKLPTSTEFNYIEWDKNRILNPINEIDTISHNGAVKNEKCSPSHNIVATLAVFESVFNRIANGLTQFEKVVVTADHGSSRLAVIAHEERIDTTLTWSGEPQDWRYSIAPLNVTRSPEFESCYDVENRLTYWIVRGYNRLPKKGGKLSVHGGATFEERLVPIIIFSKTRNESDTKQIVKPQVEQIVEKMDFDI